MGDSGYPYLDISIGYGTNVKMVDRKPPSYAGTGPEYGFFCPVCYNSELVVSGLEWGQLPLKCPDCKEIFAFRSAPRRPIGGVPDDLVYERPRGTFTWDTSKMIDHIPSDERVREAMNAMGAMVHEFEALIRAASGTHEILNSDSGLSRSERRAANSPKKKGTGKVPSWTS